ncbi:MAG: hypothetical protein WAM30_18470, partial [Candidatus Dormiibacterota bacterium]
MRSASTESRRRRGGLIAAAVLVALIAPLTATSTTTANWLAGEGRLPLVAIAAAVVVAALAIAPIPRLAGIAGSVVLAPLAAALAAGWDPLDARGIDFGFVGTWFGAIGSGLAFGDAAFLVFVLALLFWLAVAWLGWAVLHWNHPLLGLLPIAALLATNVLNFPDGQIGFVLGFLILCCALLLVSAYEGSIADAGRLRIQMADDVRWGFWEAGVVVSIAVLVVAVFLPPLSSKDQTVNIQNGAFQGWAGLQQWLDHPLPLGEGVGGEPTIGFTTEARLGGPLRQSSQVVFTYSTDGQLPTPYYFSGVELPATTNGEWRSSPIGGDVSILPRQKAIHWADPAQMQTSSQFAVTMRQPPSAAPQVLFLPGQLEQINQPVRVEALGGGARAGTSASSGGALDLRSVLSLGQRATSYRVDVSSSDATESSLRSASTDYPAWVAPYRNFLFLPGAAPGAYAGDGSTPVGAAGPYRSPAVMRQIHQLA